MNLRFIKPSHNFYNKTMSQWFKYIYLHEAESHPTPLNPDLVKIGFIQFAINASNKDGQWSESFTKPLEKVAEILANEYCHLKTL